MPPSVLSVPSVPSVQLPANASSAFHWNESATALTEAERALAPIGVSGVYREGSRKAWFVARPSPFDPNGTLLLLR